MGNDGIDRVNGKDRRKGEDRRKRERRSPDCDQQEGVLTTRVADRRRQPRRAADRKSGKKPAKS
jgi:hypothetical protein